MAEDYDFSNKHSLLDTNILKEMTQKTKRSESFKPIFEYLKEKNTTPFIIEPTKFEFIGYSSNKTDYDKLTSFVGQFSSIPLQNNDIETATLLSSIYKNKNPSINPKQISFVDCLYASQIIKFQSRAFIVTTDVNDYPSFLFDMPYHIAIEEADGATSFVGFKTYNKEKWEKLQKNFKSS